MPCRAQRATGTQTSLPGEDLPTGAAGYFFADETMREPEELTCL
jgi:hypothetical protein